MDWNLILNIADRERSASPLGMTCGFILMDALRIAARIVFFILATVVFLLRLGVGAIFDVIAKLGEK